MPLVLNGSGTISGTLETTTPAVGDDDNSIATTAFVNAEMNSGLKPGSFTSLSASGNTTLGDSAADTVTIPGGLSVSGRIASSTGLFNPYTAGNWQSAAVKATGAYGGGVAWVDGAAGFASWAQNSGADWYLGYGATSGTLTPALMVNNSGAVTVTAGSFGYGTGAGGTVTQATSKAYPVTLNKPSGQVTMHNAALAAGATVFFYLSNTSIAAGDSLIVTPFWSTGDYQVWAATVYAGTVLFAVKNISAGSLSDAFVFRFAVMKISSS